MWLRIQYTYLSEVSSGYNINIHQHPDNMEGLFGVRLESHPALHLVMDPDHPIPIPSAPPSPQEADWEIRFGGGGHSASILGHVFFPMWN